MHKRHSRHPRPDITTLATKPPQPNTVPPLDNVSTETRLNRLLVIARYRAWRQARH